jgi:hypothetical protein
MKPRSTKGALLGALACLGLLASLAQAEVAKEGNLIVSFHGAISPQKLPRDQSAPVGVQMGGKIKTSDKSTPPKLERIILDINANGKLQNKGLPSCSFRKLNSIKTSAGARKACKDAQVGHGNVTSRVSLPEQGAFASNGLLQAFNGKYKGHTAIFAQVVSGPPLPLAYVIIFEVKKTKGTFGTSLIGTLPAIASEYGYISAFDLSLKRQYRHNGKKLSFAEASCPAAKGFPGASFTFAKASYEFSDGRTVSEKLTRECKVRK